MIFSLTFFMLSVKKDAQKFFYLIWSEINKFFSKIKKFSNIYQFNLAYLKQSIKKLSNVNI